MYSCRNMGLMLSAKVKGSSFRNSLNVNWYYKIAGVPMKFWYNPDTGEFISVTREHSETVSEDPKRFGLSSLSSGSLMASNPKLVAIKNGWVSSFTSSYTLLTGLQPSLCKATKYLKDMLKMPVMFDFVDLNIKKEAVSESSLKRFMNACNPSVLEDV